MDAPDRPAPFAPGSVSFRCYPHNDLDAPAIVGELCDQAVLALDGGFDGVMTSEHHGGFAGYLAQPLQMAAFVLDARPTGWAAACPLLLPLRPTALVAEEVAWLAARHPGRVGLGVAAGALPLDFEVADRAPADAVPVFKAELGRLVAMLRGDDLGPVAGDPALAACRDRPVPVLSAAVSTAAAVRAARSGAGLLLEGMSTADRLARVTAAYDGAGGTGTRMLIRRVWLGRPPDELVRRQRAVYDSYSGATVSFGDDQTVASEDPAEVVDRLAGLVADCGADALNLRVHLPGMAPGVVRDQLERLGPEVAVPLRARLAGDRPRSGAQRE